MGEIAQAFKCGQVVIIHGTSGQGKTTLASRYLSEFYPEQWRFSVQMIETRQHALRIARALGGHAQAIQAHMAVFIDV